jgi:hypothetical protein
MKHSSSTSPITLGISTGKTASQAAGATYLREGVIIIITRFKSED